MAMNGGTISGRVFRGGWTKGADGIFVALESLTLGGETFSRSPVRPEVETANGGYYALAFAWFPQHIGKIDQHLRVTVSARREDGTLLDKATVRVSLYVSLGKIWAGAGGSHLSREIPDIINSWVDVHTTLRKVKVPQVLKQTGWMSPEAYALLGHCNLQA